MKASTFIALMFGVMIGVAGTFGGLYATGSLSTDDSSPHVAARDKSDSDTEVADKDLEEIGRPDAAPHTSDATTPKESDVSHKPEPTDALNPTVVEPDSAEGTDIEPVLENPNLTDEEKAKAQREAIAKALRDVLGEDGIIIPEGIDGDDIGGMFGGPKVELNASLAGTVIDSSGVPIGNARIYASYSEEMNSGGGMSIAIAGFSSGGDAGTPIATTDSSGNWTAQVSRQVGEKSKLRVSLTAKADSFADSKSKSVTIKNGDAKEGIKLTLRGAGSVTGYVRDASGTGVSGITVNLNKGSGGGIFGGGFMMYGGGGGLSAKTDSSGFFRISNVPEGSYTFRLEATGVREVSGPKEVTVSTGVETIAPAAFVVVQTTALRLKLVDEEGVAFNGYLTVKVVGTDGEAVKTMSGMADKEGVITLNDPPVGAYNVEITAWGYEKTTVFCDFRENQTYDAGTVTLKESETAPMPSGILPE